MAGTERAVRVRPAPEGVLLVCGEGVFDPFAPAMVAWNGSFEAAAALEATDDERVVVA